MIVRCCVYGARGVLKSSKQKDKKTFQKELAQQTDCSRTSSSTATHLLRSVCNNLLCLLCRCTLGIYSQTHLPQIHATVLYVMFLPQPCFFFWLLAVNPPPPLPGPGPGLDDTFTFHKSIFETQQLPHATGRQRKSISQRSWRCSIVSSVTSCLIASQHRDGPQR